MAQRNSNTFIGLWIPTSKLIKVDEVAEKQTSSRSQVIRYAALKELGLL